MAKLLGTSAPNLDSPERPPAPAGSTPDMAPDSITVSLIAPNNYDDLVIAVKKLVGDEEDHVAKLKYPSAEWDRNAQTHAEFVASIDTLRFPAQRARILAVFAASNQEGRVIGVRLLDRMQTIEELKIEAVRGNDVVRTVDQRRGVGTQLRVAAFRWMMDHGYARYVAVIRNSDIGSFASLGKAAELVGANIRSVPRIGSDAVTLHSVEFPPIADSETGRAASAALSGVPEPIYADPKVLPGFIKLPQPEQDEANAAIVLKYLSRVSPNLDLGAARILNVGSGFSPMRLPGILNIDANAAMCDFGQASGAAIEHVSIAGKALAIQRGRSATFDVLLLHAMATWIKTYTGRFHHSASEFWKDVWTCIKPGGWLLVIFPAEKSYVDLLKAIEPDAPAEAQIINSSPSLDGAIAFMVQKRAAAPAERRSPTDRDA